jgi:Uncharacterised protein conserved in bacteria (DUF2336)
VVNGILISAGSNRPVQRRAPRGVSTRQRSLPIVFLNALLKQTAVGSREIYSVAYLDMTTAPLFQGFDGLMTLSRREGVDIRPTLLRVLTDLYVQTNAHSSNEERQFVELTSRLIDQVDDATRAAVRARLAIYPGTPAEIRKRLGLQPSYSDPRVPLAGEIHSAPAAPPPVKAPSEAQLRMASSLSMQPKDAAEISDMFFRASASERGSILHNLHDTPLKAAARIATARAARAIEILEMAAFAADVENFALELGEALILPARIAAQVVNDPSGEPLACAARALNMPSAIFQRVLLFLKPESGSSVYHVYRLSRLFDSLSERSALIMLAAWRGSTLAVTRAKYRPGLYDDERNRERAAPTKARPAQPGNAGAVARTGSGR